MPYRSYNHYSNGLPSGYRRYAEPHSKPFSCCGCPNIFVAVMVYGMLATIFMIVFICFTSSSGHQYEEGRDPFKSSNYYRRKAKDDIGLYEPKQKEEHLEELQKRLADLQNDFRDVKDLKVTVLGSTPTMHDHNPKPSPNIDNEGEELMEQQKLVGDHQDNSRDKKDGNVKQVGSELTLHDSNRNDIPKESKQKKELKERLADLLEDFRDINDLKKKYSSHCKTCSLVTSSGRLLFHQAGEDIDSAQCVIRMNNAPVVGYEEYVGKKTTTRIVCFRSVANLRKSMLAGKGHTDEVMVWGAESPAHGRWAMSKLKMLRKSYSKTKWFSLKDIGEEKVNLIFESETGISRAKSHTWLSTGLFTMLYALQTCDDITVYGMVDENYCKLNAEIEAPYHYWEHLPWNECEFLNMHENEKKQGHRYLTEKALYRRFASMFNVKFRYPDWNLTNESKIDINSPFREKYMKEHTQR